MTNGQCREYEGKSVAFLLPQKKKTQKSLICPQPAVSALLGKPLPDKQAFLRFISALCQCLHLNCLSLGVQTQTHLSV